jgi:hypothetical protein
MGYKMKIEAEHPTKQETLAEINRHHLTFAGYRTSEITKFGNLGKLTVNTMSELIRRKTLGNVKKRLGKAT